MIVQDRVIGRVLGSRQKLQTPLALKLLRRFPFLRRIPARIIGIGFRPEHVEDIAPDGSSAPQAGQRRAARKVPWG